MNWFIFSNTSFFFSLKHLKIQKRTNVIIRLTSAFLSDVVSARRSWTMLPITILNLRDWRHWRFISNFLYMSNELCSLWSLRSPDWCKFYLCTCFLQTWGRRKARISWTLAVTTSALLRHVLYLLTFNWPKQAMQPNLKKGGGKKLL